MEETITLREINQENLDAILRLKVASEQEQFVASNATSIAQAHFQDKAWFRAIYAGETPVGFVMLYMDTEKPEYFLWRYMIDGRLQGKGYGREALRQVIEFVRGQPNARELKLSYVPAEGSPGPFYRKLGFVDTDEWMDDERVMRLDL